MKFTPEQRRDIKDFIKIQLDEDPELNSRVIADRINNQPKFKDWGVKWFHVYGYMRDGLNKKLGGAPKKVAKMQKPVPSNKPASSVPVDDSAYTFTNLIKRIRDLADFADKVADHQRKKVESLFLA